MIKYLKSEQPSKMWSYAHFHSPAFGSAITDMQYVNDTNRSYRYGFNGQEKENEIAGRGDFNTAEFWVYDCRIGRRFNIDPIYKHYLSNYSVFNNSPIALIDPKGDDTYLNSKTGEKKTTMGDGNDVRLISDEDYTKARQEFVADKKAEYVKKNPNATKEQIADFELLIAPGLFGAQGKSYVDKYSRLVTFESMEDQKAFITKMETQTEGKTDGQDDDSKDVEQGGFIVLDLANAHVKFIHTASGVAGVNQGTLSGDNALQTFSDKKYPNLLFADKEHTLLVLADWHTHPQNPGHGWSRGPSTPLSTVMKGGSDTENNKMMNLTGFVFDWNIYVVEKNGEIQKNHEGYATYSIDTYNVIENAWILYYQR